MITILNAEINILGIILATIVSMGIGMLWYGPLFGKIWMALVNKKLEDLEAKPTDYLSNIIAGIISAFVISLLYSYISTASAFFALSQAFGASETSAILSGEWSLWLIMLFIPFVCWTAFTLPVSINRIIWEGGRKKLVALNAAHQFVTFLFMSIVIALVLNFS